MISVTWLGHATVLIEVDGARLLTDPVLRDRVGTLVRIAGPAERPGPVDAVLLSHLHADHADAASLELVESPLAVAPSGAGAWLAKHTTAEVRELRTGEGLSVAGVRVEATPAAHDGRRWPVGGARAEPLGYVVRGDSGSVYFAGDTELFPEMAALTGTIDIALLPVAGWGPTLGPGHLDAERAARAAALIAPRVAVPIHWGTFAPVWPLRRHRDPSRPPREFAALVAERAPEVDVRVLAPGERTECARG